MAGSLITHRRSVADLLTGAGALAVLGLLLIGVPLGLMLFAGWPLPHTLPTWGGVRSFLSGPIPDVFWLHFLAVLAWLLWAWLAGCVVLELGAQVRGRLARRIPGSGQIQVVAAKLVAAALALSGPTLAGSRLTHAQAATPPAAASAPGPTVAVGSTLAPPPPTRPSDEQPDQPSGRSYTVAARDTLWSIAARELGDPEQWPRIAQLNYGRPQADGRSLTDAHWIYPGWELLLPPDASPSAGVAAPVLPPSPPSAAPVPSGGASGPTSSTPGSSTGLGPRPDAVGTEVGGTTNTNRQAPTTKRSPIPTSLPQRSDSVISSSHAPGRSGHALAEVTAPLGLAVVAGGVTAILRLRRRVQQRRRRPDRRITLPPRSLVDLETTLQSAAPSKPDLLEVGLCLLTAKARETAVHVPTILAVRRGEDHLDLLLEEPAPDAPAPFVAVAEGSTWRLDTGQLSEAVLNESPEEIAPCPTLVTVGEGADGRLLVHLEAARHLTCGGDTAAAVAGLASMAVELATRAWQGGFGLALVDFPAQLEPLQGLHQVNLEQALATADAEARTNAEHLLRHGWDAPSAAVLAGSIDPPAPYVVMCCRRLDDDEARRVAELTASGRSGVVVVALDDPGLAPWHLDYRGEQVSLSPLGLTLRSARLDSVELDGLDELLGAAMAEDCGPDAEPYVDHAPIGAGARLEVEILLLGPVEIVGGAEPITNALALELVAFLAARGGPVTTEAWTTALRPDRRLSHSYVNNTTWLARRALGKSRDDRPHLPPADGRIGLAETVGSDWGRFRELAASNSAQDWDAALGLVRGQPFEGCGWDWPSREGLVAAMEAEVVDLAISAGTAALDRHELERAAAAASAGMAASPWDERSYRLLMRVRAAEGDTAGVRAVMRQLCRVLEAEVEPFDTVTPETQHLFAELTTSRLAAEG